MEPVYQGEPILAVAAVDELTAAEAIEKIQIDFEPLPFVVDPLETPAARRPERANRGQRLDPAAAPAPRQRRAAARRVTELKWTEADFAEAKDGRLPMGKAPDEWSYGDLDAGFKNAALVLDETFVTPNTSHQTLETRTAMAYWQNGKVYVHTGTQSTAQTVPAIARWLNIDPDKVVLISEYTGGGFGSKITGGVSLIIPALLSKKANAPVMMRISREEEHYIGRARPGFQGRMKVGFSKDGRITGARHVRDLRQRSVRRAGRCRHIGPHRLAAVPAAGDALARRDGADQHAAAQRAELAGRHAGHRASWSRSSRRPRASSGIDQVAIRRINAPRARRRSDRRCRGKRPHATSAFIKEALDRGAEQFKWERESGAHAEAERHEGARRRRVAERLRRRLDRLRRAFRHQARRPALHSSPASATSAPSR